MQLQCFFKKPLMGFWSPKCAWWSENLSPCSHLLVLVFLTHMWTRAASQPPTSWQTHRHQTRDRKWVRFLVACCITPWEESVSIARSCQRRASSWTTSWATWVQRTSPSKVNILLVCSNAEVFLCHKLKLLDQQLNPAVVFHNSMFLLLLSFPADLEVLMARLNIGPSHVHDHENDHNHEDDHQHRSHDHTDHDHTGLRLKKRSSPEHHMEREGNSSWDQVRWSTHKKNWSLTSRD